MKHGGEEWHSPRRASIFVEAFTTTKYKLGFRLAKLAKNKKVNLNENDDVDFALETALENQNTANRSSAVHVRLTGLNLARSLRCMSTDQFKHVSLEIGKCTACVWMEFDKAYAARYVTIVALNHFVQIEMKNGSSWQKLFDVLFKIKDSLAMQKQKILNPLLEKLTCVSQTINSPYKTCAKQLKDYVQHLNVVLFSVDDTCVHAIKCQFATYLKKNEKKFKGIRLNSNASNTLTMLKSKHMTFFNLNMFLSADQVYNCNLPTPVISDNIKSLKHQPKSKFNNFSVLALCKQRGKIIGPQLLECWSNVGHFFLQHFELDIFSIHFGSLSFLAYTAVWSKYFKMAGIFHQGLEKTKTAYESVFRSFSQGGFSYSCNDFIECGRPIHGSSGDNASSLLSFDIISSYGYAGSSIETPTGFCNAYFDNGRGVLQLSEPFARHNSFEFLSVYYTLYLLSQQTEFEISTIYSNFHSGGIFSIGNYPLDLAVVFNTGDISLYQFDGAFAHGCRNGCPLFNSFVRGRQRQELEADSEKRDNVIQQWVQEINNGHFFRASYHVITDCHDQSYDPKILRQQFYSISVLANLVKGYPFSKTLTKDDVLFSSNDLTYIIVLEGFVPKELNHPLLVKNKDNKGWKRTCSTQSNAMMMTKDYLTWLVKHFNFQVDTIQCVFFYKKCMVLNSIFKELTCLRMSPTISSSVKTLLKNVINFSAGYFGLNEKKQAKKTSKLMCNVGSYFKLKKHVAQHVGNFENHNYFIVTTARKTKSIQRMSVAPLPIFVCIVEFGKKRLSEILCFFETHLLPHKYRHLYSNVDNVLFVLSTRTLDEAVDPQKLQNYLTTKSLFFQENAPGHLKPELAICSDQDWKFVSHATMQYSIATKDPRESTYKCHLNNLSCQEVFDYSLKRLNKQSIAVNQTRRVNKVVNKDVETVTFQFN